MNENVLMLRSAKGVSDFIAIDPEWVQSELGLSTEQITDYMGLVGDSSDNIPGVEGIGPKSASALLQKHKSLKNIYAKIEEISPQGLQRKLKENKEKAFLSQELANIQTELKEIQELDIKKLQVPDFLSKKTLEYFRKKAYDQIHLELQKAQSNAVDSNASASTSISFGRGKHSRSNYNLIQSIKELEEALQKITKQMKKERILVLDTETNSPNALEARLVGISLSVKEKEAIYIPLLSTESLFAKSSLAREKATPILKKFLENPHLRIVGQNLKYDYIVLKRWGIDLPPPYFDSMLASYVCNPILRRHSLDAMALDFLGYECISYEELVGKGKQKKTLEELAPEQVYEYACEDADITFRLYGILKKQIKKNKLERVYNEIEMPLLPVLIAHGGGRGRH